jgi:hypothetical protein
LARNDITNLCRPSKDDSLTDSDKLPAPAVIAQEIVEDLQAALEQFRLTAGDLEAATGLQEA